MDPRCEHRLRTSFEECTFAGNPNAPGVYIYTYINWMGKANSTIHEMDSDGFMFIRGAKHSKKVYMY